MCRRVKTMSSLIAATTLCSANSSKSENRAPGRHTWALDGPKSKWLILESSFKMISVLISHEKTTPRTNFVCFYKYNMLVEWVSLQIWQLLRRYSELEMEREYMVARTRRTESDRLKCDLYSGQFKARSDVFLIYNWWFRITYVPSLTMWISCLRLMKSLVELPARFFVRSATVLVVCCWSSKCLESATLKLSSSF